MSDPHRPPEGAGDPSDADPVADLAGLAEDWRQVITEGTFVPGPPARTQTLLASLLTRLLHALRDEPFEAIRGRGIGRELVTLRMSTPAVLGNTIALLSRRIPALLTRVPDPDHRLDALLGQLAQGFAEAQRDAVVRAAEEINRAERAAWRRRQHELQEDLRYTLEHDPITGLPNRASLVAWLTGHLADAAPGDRLGICLLKIDDVEAINHTLGHDVGDNLLQVVAGRLRPLATTHGWRLAHFDRDEFALVSIDTTGPEDVIKMADQAQRVLPSHLPVDGHRRPVTGKAGLVEQHAATSHPLELLRAAHAALSWATADRQPYALYEPKRSHHDLRRHRLTTALPTALQTGQVILHYQPLRRLADNRIIGFEALARWPHPDLGLLMPDEFIPLAEQAGLIDKLDLTLLEQGCRQAATWPRHGYPTPLLSVNLSPTQLANPELPAAITSILHRTGLPPGQLQLEITEGADLPEHHTTLRQLAEHGIGLAVDDFGTGYSNLVRLAELPIASVKLAGSFLRCLYANERRDRLTRFLADVTAMCHRMDISVTAEQIETAAEARELHALGCDVGQGYHLGRPADSQQVARLLDER